MMLGINTTESGIDLFGLNDTLSPDARRAWWIVSTVSAIASGYHGAKRNHGSVGYGVLWFILGGTFPIIVPTIALAQGYAKPKAKK